MKNKKRHIIMLSFLIWRFLYVVIPFFKKPERAAKQQILTFYICFSVAVSFAQQYTNYSTKDGLPSNHVYTIIQDAKGFMWFLTDKGMTRFNGNQLITFTTKDGLPNNDVWDAFPTPDGKVWYMSKSASLGYVKEDSILSFPNSNKNKIINPIYSSQVGDSIYPSGPNRTFTLKDKQWVGEVNKSLNDLFLDKVKVRHRKVSNIRFEGTGKINVFDKKNTILTSFYLKNIHTKTGSRGQINDSLFFWTTNKNYTIINFNTLKIKTINLKKSIGMPEVKYLRINQVNGDLQISGSGFVAKLDENYEIVNPFFFPKNKQAHFGFIDKLNTVWLATFNNGVYKLPYVKRNVKYELLNEKIQSFNILNKELIAGVYEKGFYKYNPKEKTFQEFIKSDDYIFGASPIKQLKTNFYLFKNAILKEENETISTLDLSEIYMQEYDINEIGRKLLYFEGKLYGNFSFGINQLNLNSLKVEKEFRQKGANDIVCFKDRLLIATTNGLKEIKNDSLQPIVFENRTFNKSILSVKKINDTSIIINTDGFGAYISDLKEIKPLVSTAFLIVEEAFIQDEDLWLATNTGVLKFTKTNSDYQLDKQFTIEDGLPTDHINTVFVDDENLIVGTNNGIAILPKNKESIPQLLDVYIGEAKYNNKLITADSSTFKYTENNNVNITVANIDFSENNTDFLYDFKLEPSQKNWTTTNTNIFNFNNLQPDSYVFHFKSGTINKQLQFTIKPLWWQAFWFKVFVVLLGVFLVALISRFFVRRSQFKKNQKVFEDKRLSELQLKALRSQMNPHFVFNSLSAIQYYIGENDFEASETYLVKFSKLIRQFFELSKENEISLAIEISLLNNYLEIEKLRFKEKLNFTINVDPSLDKENTKIPTMLLQPIVENAVNHGVFNKMDNGLVALRFIYIDTQTFKVEIVDDGVGFVNTKKRQNKSVKSSNVLKDRLHFLNYSEKWEISYKEEEVHPDKKDKGNKSVFLIKKSK
ncbi:MAG: histidine kinase [Oceanihabitans sp.]|nr:histidine kinase [Oceanihabitans sp.]